MAPCRKGPAIKLEAERCEELLIRRFEGEIPFNVGSRDSHCIHCGALRWALERTAQNQKTNSHVYSNCCQQGDVTLPMADFDGPLIPDDMIGLFKGHHPGK